MKYFYLILLFQVSFFLLNAQNNTVPTFITALQNSKTSELQKYMDATVSINLPNKNDIYSKSQAAAVLIDFFTMTAIQNFTIERTLKRNEIYIAKGILFTTKNNFTFYFYYLQNKNSITIQQIEIFQQH